MIGDWFPYLIGVLTIAVTLYSTRRSSNSTERRESADQAQRRETRLDKLERTVAYLRKRDLWRQECFYRVESALTDALKVTGGTMPTMPPEPEPEPNLLGE